MPGSAEILGDEVQVTTSTASQSNPDIDGDRIVWQDNRNVYTNIYMYDLATGTETRVTADSANQNNPTISGDRIVWADHRSDYYEVYMYDLLARNETRITSDMRRQYHPVICGSRMAWWDWVSGNSEIYMYDLDTGIQTQITADAGAQEAPDIDGGRVVWQDDRNGNWDIYIYDVATGDTTQVTTDTHTQVAPAIQGDRVVWQDDRNGNWDVYMHDLDTGTETRLTTDAHAQVAPAIHGGRIVWQDDRNGNWDVYMYDLDTGNETRFTTNAADQTNPAVCDRWVVWQDARNGNPDIYARKLWRSARSPRWAVLPTFHATEDVPVEVDLAGYCSDPDTALAGLRLGSQSPHVTAIDGMGATFLFPDEATSASVPVILSDGDQEAFADLNFTIDPRNDPPGCTVPTERTVTEDAPCTIDFGPYVTDPDSPREALAISTDSPYATVQGLNLTLTYPGSVLGDVVWVNVTDGLLATEVRLDITVNPVDDTPVVLPMPVFVAVEDRDSVFNITPYLQDEDTPVDQLRILARDPNCTVVGKELHFLFEQPVDDLNVPLEVADSHTRVTATLRVTVTPVDDPPIVGDVPPQLVLEDEPSYIDLSPYVTDEDTPEGELMLECTSPHFVGAEGLNLMLLYHTWQPEHTVEFSVSDGTGHGNGLLTVKVQETNDPPVILGVGDLEPPVVVAMDEGEELWLAIRVSDEDGSAFTYYVSSPWRGISVHQNGTLRLAAAQADLGTNHANVTVDDLAGGTATLEITVVVANVDDPPSVLAITSPANHTTAEEGTNVTFRVDVADPDRMLGQVLTVTWTSNVSGPLMTLTSDVPLTFTTDALPAGVHRITVTVSDGTHTRTAWLELTVTKRHVPPPQEPAFLATPAGIAAILIVIALVVIVALLGASRTRRLLAEREVEERERARAEAARRRQAEAEVEITMGGDLARLSRDLGASAAKLEAQRAAEAVVAAPAVPAQAPAPVATATAVTAEEEADRERTRETREVMRALTQLPQGLPTSLAGWDMSELARAIVDGERRTATDGKTQLVLVKGSWYCADRTDVGKFAREWKEPEPAARAAPAPADMGMEERIERLETALLEGKISETTYQELKRKYEGS